MIELPRMFMNTCCRRIGSPTTCSWTSSPMLTLRIWFFASIWGFMTASRRSIDSAISKFSSLSETRPLSMRDMSRTSLMRSSRCRLAIEILSRQSFTRSGRSTYMVAMAVSPIIEFIGVRMSCDMELRKSLFAREARSAMRRASSRALRLSSSRRLISLTSCTAHSALTGRPAASLSRQRTEVWSHSARPPEEMRYSNCRYRGAVASSSLTESPFKNSAMTLRSSSSKARESQCAQKSSNDPSAAMASPSSLLLRYS